MLFTVLEGMTWSGLVFVEDLEAESLDQAVVLVVASMELKPTHLRIRDGYRLLCKEGNYYKTVIYEKDKAPSMVTNERRPGWDGYPPLDKSRLRRRRR